MGAAQQPMGCRCKRLYGLGMHPAGGTPAKLGATAAAHTTAMWDRAGPAANWPAQAFCGRAPRRCAMA